MDHHSSLGREKFRQGQPEDLLSGGIGDMFSLKVMPVERRRNREVVRINSRRKCESR